MLDFILGLLIGTIDTFVAIYLVEKVGSDNNE